MTTTVATEETDDDDHDDESWRLRESTSWRTTTTSCHSLYQMYLRLPVFVTKRAHSESQSADAIANRNARHLHHAETGRWGLPDRPWGQHC